MRRKGLLNAVYQGKAISDEERRWLREEAAKGNIAACGALARNARNEALRLPGVKLGEKP